MRLVFGAAPFSYWEGEPDGVLLSPLEAGWFSGDLNMELTVTNNPEPADDDFVIENTRRYNEQFVENAYEPLSVYIRDSRNQIIAGLTGKTFWKWLHVEFLWVSEEHRGRSLGSRVMSAAESEAVKRGCIGSTLDTFSFQALGFYQKLGYQLVGTLSGYAGEYERHYLQKPLIKEMSRG